MAPCPNCGVVIQIDPGAPMGVAIHDCGTVRSPQPESRDKFRHQLAALAMEEEAGGKRLANLALRGVVLNVLDGDVPRDMGDILKGYAEVEKVGAGNTQQEFLEWISRIDEDDEDEEDE